MDVRVFDRGLSFRGIVDNVLSYRASREFTGAGSCLVRVPLAAAGCFTPDGIVRFPGDGGDFLICSIYEDSASGTAEIVGQGLLSYFERRAVTETIRYSGNMAEKLCTTALTWGASVLPGTIRAETVDLEADASVVCSRGTLYAALRQMCAAAGLGMRLTWDADTGAFSFSALPRRSSPLFLSRSAGNLFGAQRRRDYGAYRNRAIVCGADGETVTVEAAGLFEDGTDDASEPIREIFREERDLDLAQFTTEAAYREALFSRGRQLLAQCRPVGSLTATVSGTAARQLSPGDVCGVFDSLLGVKRQALCTSRTLSDGGYAAVMQLIDGEGDNAK